MEWIAMRQNRIRSESGHGSGELDGMLPSSLPRHLQGAFSDHRAQDLLDQHGVSGAFCPQLATTRPETIGAGGRLTQVPASRMTWVRERMQKEANAECHKCQWRWYLWETRA